MSIQLQIILIISSIILFLLLIKTVKGGKLRTDYATGWILSSIVLIIIAIFPQIAYFFTDALGVMSAANMIFAIIILILIVLVYLLFAKVSMLEEKQKNIIQELAILKEKNHLQ